MREMEKHGHKHTGTQTTTHTREHTLTLMKSYHQRIGDRLRKRTHKKTQEPKSPEKITLREKDPRTQSVLLRTNLLPMNQKSDR